jgi:hypothetical protein
LNEICSTPQVADAPRVRFWKTLGSSPPEGWLRLGTIFEARQPNPDATGLDLSTHGIALFQVADELYNARRFNLPAVR